MSATRWCVPAGMWVLVLALGGTAVRAEETTEQVIEKLKAKTQSVESGRANMKMTFSMMGQNIAMQGKLLFKKPRKTRVETSMNLGAMKMDQIMISDGTTMWSYQPAMKVVSKMDVQKLTAAAGTDKAGQQNSGDITRPLEGLEPESIKLLETKELDGVKTYLLEGSPQTAEMPNIPFKPAKIRIWVGADDGLLRKMVMLDKDGKEMMAQTYENIELGIDVPDSTFEFTPPEGVQVMDITEGAINMIKGMKKPEK